MGVNISEVIAQLSSQALTKGDAEAVCIIEGESDLYIVKDICWDEELNTHVIEIQLYQ